MITTVVNLFGGPGVGKSTTAAGVFSLLKQRGVLCELAHEYAKDLCWEGNPRIAHQLSVLAEQAWRVERLMGKVKFVITDSPILLSAVYAQQSSRLSSHQADLIRALAGSLHRDMRTFNILLERVKPYQSAGRYQDEDGARALDVDIRNVLRSSGVTVAEIPGDRDAAPYIANLLTKEF